MIGEQLGLLLGLAGADAPKKKRAPKEDSREDMCACGHSRDHHADGRRSCLYGMGQRFFNPETNKYENAGCQCPKFRVKKRGAAAAPVGAEKPAGGVDWFRGPPEIKTKKLGGWFLLERTPARTRAIVFVAATKLVSENVIRRRAASKLDPVMASRLIAGDSNTRKGHQYRVEAALEQARLEELGAPTRAVVTRIGSPRIRDDDNLVSACKHIRDAIAGGLGFDDSRFKIAGVEGAGTIPLVYRQATSGKRKAYAVLLELEWAVTEGEEANG